MIGNMMSNLRRANPWSGLEDSPEGFWEHYSEYAVVLGVSPEPMGSPMLELLTPYGPLFVFDRGLVPLSASSERFILHGQVKSWQETQRDPGVEHLGGGAYRLTGQVSQHLDGICFLLQIGSLPVVLAGQDKPNPGSTVEATLYPPLMAFRAESNRL